MADTDLAEEVRKRRVADSILEDDDPDPDDLATEEEPEQKPEEEKPDKEEVSIPKGVNYYLGPAFNPPTSAQPEAPKTPEKPAAADTDVIDTSEFAGDPMLTKSEEPPGAIELPALTVEGVLPRPVSMATRELPAPPEGYGVAPRAELVQLPPPRTGPVSMAAREIPLPAPRAELVPPPVPSVAAASRELDLAPLAEPVVRRAELVDPDPDRAAFEAAGIPYPGTPVEVRRAYPAGTAPRAQPVQQPVAPQEPAAEQPVAPRAVAAGAPPPVQRAQLNQPQGATLGQVRQRFERELADPATMQLLMASTQAEVGDQPTNVWQAYMESVMNRATAEGRSLRDVLLDPKYYPEATKNRLGELYSGPRARAMMKITGDVLDGSNISNLATGNESGNVHSGGARVAYNPQTGERFVVENWTKGWADNLAEGGPAAKPAYKLNYVLGPPLDPEQRESMAVHDAQNQSAQRQTLAALGENQTFKGFIDQLSKPVEGVNDALRNSYLGEVKREATAYAQEYYGEKDPQKAYQRITTDPDVGTFAGDVMRRIVPQMNQAVTAFNQASQTIDENKVNQFADFVHPGMTPEQRTAFVHDLVSKPPEERGPYINALISQLQKEGKDVPPGIDANQISYSAERLGDPDFQAKRKVEVDRQVAQNLHDLRTDPRLNATAAWWSDQLSSLPKNVVEAMGSWAGGSLMLSEIHQGVYEGLKKEHPDWDEDRLRTTAGLSSLPQVVLQEIIQRATAGMFGGVVRGITNPVQRIAANAALHLGIGGTAGAAGRIAQNVAEGRAPLEGVPEAAGAGAIQAAPGAVIGGFHRAPENVPRGTIVEPPVREEIPPPVREAPVPPLEERPVPREEIEPPVHEEEQPEQDAIEEKLNRQNQELEKRYGVEGELEPKPAPIEEEPKPADIIPSDEKEAVPAGDMGGVTGEIGPSEGERVVGGPGVGDSGRGQTGGGEDVSGELRRVQSPLEVKLSPEQRAALEPLVETLRNTSQGTLPGKMAYKAIFDKVWQHFGPLFKAGGIERRDDPFGFNGIAGARTNNLGHLGLLLNHDKLENAARKVQAYGNDPVEYLRSVLQEELFHHAENLSHRDVWNREKAQSKEGFIQYKFRKNRSIIDNWLKARDRARTKGNHALADEMDKGLLGSVQIYHDFRDNPAAAESWIRSQLDAADKGYEDAKFAVTNVASEMMRQMLQLKHGDMSEQHYETLMGRAVIWIRNVIDGLKSLYAKLGPGQILAKTELAKMTRVMERKLATLQRRAEKAISKSEAGTETTGTRELITEAPGAKKTVREHLSDAIKRAKAAYGLAFKGGESALLDYDETRALARAIRRKPSLVQAYGQRARLVQLADAFNSVPARERERVKREFEAYTRAEQNKQPLPAVGADTLRLINAGKDTLEGFGQIAKELNLHVKDANGRVRPMRLIGRDYYPRMISDDVRDMFNNRDGSRAADFDALVNRQIARGAVKDRQEFIDKFTHAISGDPYSNDHFSNLERGRQAQLPLEFYDHSPEALLRYASRAADRLAQVGSFGQKLSNKGKDLFDIATDNVNASGNLSHDAKQALINRIAAERKAQFTREPVTGMARVGGTLRTAAGGLFLSNPQTSWMNLVSGAAQNMVFGGPASFAKTVAKFPFQWKRMLSEARDRNILRSNMRNIMDDYDIATNPNLLERGIRKGTEIGLKYGGQDLTESINRVFAMQQAKEILREFAGSYGVKTGPAAKAKAEFVARRFGFRHDEDASRTLSALAREGGTGPLSDEFIRQFAMDVHGNYGPGQAAAHIFDSPAGKMITQFQKWGANTSRMWTREYLAPMQRAFKSGDPAEIGYHALRNVAYLAAGVGLTLPAQAALNALYRRDPKDPTLAEIGEALKKGDTGRAFQYAMTKAQGLLLLSGFTGLFGNNADVLRNLTGNDPMGRLKDPFHPPAWGVIEPFLSLYMGWKGEGGVLPSPTVMDTFARKLISPYRVLKQAALGTASSTGIKLPFSQEYAANNDRNFARDRISMFEATDPVLIAKKEAKGTQQTTIAMAGRSPFSPVRDRIVNGLLSGHSEDVNSAIRDWLLKVPIEEREAEYKRIKSTISSNSPLKVGGSSSPEAVMEFLQWAHENLPEGEARRIFALASTYAKTAVETGMEEKSRAMQQMARLDYDKFKAPAQSVQAQARAKAQATVAGQRITNELMRQERTAQALRER